MTRFCVAKTTPVQYFGRARKAATAERCEEFHSRLHPSLTSALLGPLLHGVPLPGDAGRPRPLRSPPGAARREGQGGKVLNIDWDIPAKGTLSLRLYVVTLVLPAGPLSALVQVFN